jgi:hypothetical protein
MMLGIAALALIGVPQPPAITKEGIGRVGWSPVLENFGDIRRSLRSRSLGVWLPRDHGMTAQAPRRIVDFRLHVVSGPGDKPRFVSQLPRSIAGFYTDPERPYVIFRSDEGGNEQFQLFRWDLGDSDPVRLTTGEERASFGAFEPAGTRIAYASTRRNGADFDIYVTDPREPDTDRLVLERDGSWSVWDWSPAGDELLIDRYLSNFVERLRANGSEVAYLEAANEGHGFANPWNAIYAGVAQMEMALDCLYGPGDD